MTCYLQEHAEFVVVLTVSLNDSQANERKNQEAQIRDTAYNISKLPYVSIQV